MINIEVIKSIICNMPWVLIFVAPGFFALTLFMAITKLDITDGNTVVGSCALSFIIVAVVRLLFSCIDNIYLQVLIVYVIAFALSISLIKLVQWKAFRNFMRNHFNYSPTKNAWEEVFDYAKGSRIKVTLKSTNDIIVGNLYSYDETGKDPWIAISYFFVFENGSKNPRNKKADDDRYFMININDIKFAEIWTNHGDPPLDE